MELLVAAVGPVAAKYGGAGVTGGIIGGFLFYFITDSLCEILEKHWFLAPFLGALASGGGIILLMFSMGY